MDISRKHLEMIQFALGRYIDELTTLKVPEELMLGHAKSVAEWVELREMVGLLLLKQ